MSEFLAGPTNSGFIEDFNNEFEIFDDDSSQDPHTRPQEEASTKPRKRNTHFDYEKFIPADAHVPCQDEDPESFYALPKMLALMISRLKL